MQVFVFGGAFDPPHLGHLTVIQSVLEKGLADEVWVVPAGNHPFSKAMSSAVSRLKMGELLVAMLPDHLQSRTRLDSYELDKKGVGYSYDTLTQFQAQFPQFRFAWLLGSDNISHFTRWKEYQKILDEFGVAVYPRQGAAEHTLLPGMRLLEQVPTISLSSTQVREAARNKGSLEDLVGKALSEYISTQRLYTPYA